MQIISRNPHPAMTINSRLAIAKALKHHDEHPDDLEATVDVLFRACERDWCEYHRLAWLGEDEED